MDGCGSNFRGWHIDCGREEKQLDFWSLSLSRGSKFGTPYTFLQKSLTQLCKLGTIVLYKRWTFLRVILPESRVPPAFFVVFRVCATVPSWLYVSIYVLELALQYLSSEFRCLLISVYPHHTCMLIFNWMLKIIAGCAVVQQCCNDDQQWENGDFDLENGIIYLFIYLFII